MNIIILAAGYGTRLQKDIINDTSGSFHHLIDCPKPLLPIKNNKPLISIWMEFIKDITDVCAVYVVVSYLNCKKKKRIKHNKKKCKFCLIFPN